MIYTVTTNPNIDYYMDLRAPLHVGGINRSGRELLAPGGKGINVSLMLQTLGKPSCVLGYLAGPTPRPNSLWTVTPPFCTTSVYAPFSNSADKISVFISDASPSAVLFRSGS